MALRPLLILTLAASVSLIGCQSTQKPTDSLAKAHLIPSQALPSNTSFTLAELYQSDTFKLAAVPTTRWLSDNSGYTSLETSATGSGQDIVRYHPATGQRDVLVSAAQLTPKGSSKPLTIANYHWSNDGQQLLIFTNTVRSWRTHTLGDYWVLNRSNNRLVQLGGTAPASSLQFAQFDPQGQQVAYVQHNNLYVQNLATQAIQQLTFDGNAQVINGTFDWVNEEEFDLQSGFRWAPNGEYIAYWQVDTTGVPIFTMIDNVSNLYPSLKQFPYPKVGQTNSALRVGVIAASGGETQWMQIAGDPRQHYIVRMEWAGNSDTLMIQHMNRAQNTLQVLLADRRNGRTQTVITEQSQAWVEQVDDVRYFRAGQSFTWQSERSGYRHLYRYDADGKQEKLTPLTSGDYDVVQLLEIVADSQGEGYAYYIASPDNPLQRYLYRVNLNGQTAPERLTPSQWHGTNQYRIAKDGQYAIHTYSRVGVPPQTRMVSLPDHTSIQDIELNQPLRQRLAERVTNTTEFFQVTTRDGLSLDGYIMKPANFDPNKKYPLIMYVYGEPWGQTVTDSWLGNGWLWHDYMTQLGYVVASVDNRGTRSPRGQAWRHSIYKQLGNITVRDQADALTAMLARWSWLDASRVGIWGHSGGGSQTLNALFRYPELFHAGIAAAPVPDLRLYDTIYQERYSGLLPEDAASYAETSAITHAKNLQGHLLIVHGTGDDNVHYQGAERLQDELIRHNKQFRFMAYPNRSHSIAEGEGTTLHLQTLKAQFFLETLPVTADETNKGEK